MKPKTKRHAAAFRVLMPLALALLTCVGANRSARAQTATPTPTPLWVQSGTNNITNTNGGNVGIGTTSPLDKLHIKGGLRVQGTSVNGDISVMTADGTTGWWDFFAWGSGNGSMGFYDVLSQTTPLIIEKAAPNNAFYVKKNGNVGIGTASPASTLHLAGSGGVSVLTLDTPGTQRFRLHSLPGVPNWGGMTLNSNYTGTGWMLDDPNTNGWFFKLDGRGGNAAAPNNGLWLYRIPPGASSHTDESPVFGVTNGQAFFEGNVGIGTANPVNKLDVAGSVHVAGVCSASVPAAQGGYVSWNQMTCGTGEMDFINHRGQGGGGFWFANTANGSTLSSLMFISGNGNVGIGTNSPAAKLDVAGNVNVSGNIVATGSVTATYQDVAEWVPSRQKLSAGTVVVLDTDLNNHVLASLKPYDTRVAGVVSAQPGLILGQGGEDKLMVATTGRVKLRVDATRAPILVGDLLVTSDIEGVAMKSIPIDLVGTPIHRPGTIIGKALEPLASGKGEILVLLSLQ